MNTNPTPQIRIRRIEDLATVRGTGPVTLAGPREHVVPLLAQIHDTGRLRVLLPPKEYPGGFVVAISLHPLDPDPPAQWRPRRSRWLVAGAAVAALVAALVAWLVVAAIMWITAHIAYILIGLAALVALAGLAGPKACTTIITITHHR